MSSTIVVVSTGVANMASILGSLHRIAGECTVIVSSDPHTVQHASHVVIPGVGSFDSVMASLNSTSGLVDVIRVRISRKEPTLLICAGLQVLAHGSEESASAVVGLDMVSVQVQRFPPTLITPQQAWNLVTPQRGPQSFVDQPGHAFFSNSYCITSAPVGWSCAKSFHGYFEFISAMQSGGVLALQFHPELSGTYGARILQRWFNGTLISGVPRQILSRSLCRVIPCLDVRDGRVVKGVQFVGLTDAGDPVELALEYERQNADELVMLDISATTEGRSTSIEVVRNIRAKCSLPITVGGGIRSVTQASVLLEAGADKISINSGAVADPSVLTRLADQFGSQCVVLAIDAKSSGPDQWHVMTHSGKKNTGLDVVEWAQRGTSLGAGEILLTSFDRDGTRQGYDLALLRAVSNAVKVPVVASGGASSAQHMADAANAGASAVLAASIFHYNETTVGQIKRKMTSLGVAVRPAPKTIPQKVKPNNIQCVIPSIDLIGGNAVQLVGGNPQNLEIDAGDPLVIAKRFRLAGDIAVVDLDAALSGGSKNNESVITQLLKIASCRVGGGIRDKQTALKWLDAGASKVVIGTAAKPALLSELPKDRVVVALDAVHGEVVVEGWKTKTGASVLERMAELKPYASNFLVTFVEGEGKMQGFPIEQVVEMVKLLDGDAQLTVAGGITTPDDIAALDALGVEAQIGMAIYSGRLSLGDAMFAPVKVQPDGLVPTAVVSEMGQHLGSVFSSRDSFREAVSTLSGVYWSRSRGRLWVKGETSGNVQELLAIKMDCDRDALQFVVRQKGNGGFCHRDNTPSCFGHAAGLVALEDRINQRKLNAPEGSYTKKLFDNEQLLQAKLIEEAHELGEAATPETVAAEAADVLYFVMVAMAKHGVKISDVERVLDARALKVSRRPGNSKEKFVKMLQERKEETKTGACTEAPTKDVPKTAEKGLLRIVGASEVVKVSQLKSPVDPQALSIVTPIVNDVKQNGRSSLIKHAVALGDIENETSKLIYTKPELKAAFESLSEEEQQLLERVSGRIRDFALNQRNTIKGSTCYVLGGIAGQSISAHEKAGVYAPGGNYPLPSSVLMGVVTARAAGVTDVVVASPKPAVVVLASAYIGGASALLAVGGAQAIAALAFGVSDIPELAQRCDVVVGPGNKYVTAAKSLVAGTVAIDMLAGPSELLVVVDSKDSSVSPSVIAADLLAQAEHDVDARPLMVVLGPTSSAQSLVARVENELESQLKTLPTSKVAREACVRNGIVVYGFESEQQALSVVDSFAAEHVELVGEAAEALQPQLKHFGALFVGPRSAEVFGDYGIGPNHTLPTGGSARSFGGLSVHTFLRIRTFLNLKTIDTQLCSDTVQLARMEGLYAHARAARIRSEINSIDSPIVGKDPVLKLALPKGRMMDNVMDLMKEAGLEVSLKGRVLRPVINTFPDWDIKLLKPRNVVEMLHHGTRHIGFAGTDLIRELGADIISVYDTQCDPVRIVAAAPVDLLDNEGRLPQRHLLVATEYPSHTAQWIVKEGLDAEVVHTYGSTEVFPPEDADLIVDNTATGTTLRANGLKIIDTLATSSTHLVVHRSVLESSALKKQLEHIILLLESARVARSRVVLEFNVPTDKLASILEFLPAMKKPTVNALYQESGFAVKVVVERKKIVDLLPSIKAHGGTDILVTDLKQVVI